MKLMSPDLWNPMPMCWRVTSLKVSQPLRARSLRPMTCADWVSRSKTLSVKRQQRYKLSLRRVRTEVMIDSRPLSVTTALCRWSSIRHPVPLSLNGLNKTQGWLVNSMFSPYVISRYALMQNDLSRETVWICWIYVYVCIRLFVFRQNTIEYKYNNTVKNAQ